MANNEFVKISLLPSGATPLSGPEEIPVVQAGTTYKFTSRAFMLPTVDPVITPMDFTSQLPMSRYLEAGLGITILDNGPGNSVLISAPAGGGQVNAVVGTAGEIDVDATDPANPIVSLSTDITGATLLTETDETADFVNSRRIVAGANITLNVATPGQMSISAAGGSPGGSDSQVQYNNGGVFGGDAAFAFNDTTKTVTIVVPALGTPLSMNDGTYGAEVDFYADGLIIGTTNGARFALKTFNSPRLIVDEQGHVSINAPSTSSAQALVVSTNASAVGISCASNAGVGAIADFQAFRNNSAINTVLAGSNIQLWNTGGTIGRTTLQQSGGQTEIWQADTGLTERQVVRIGATDRAMYTRVDDGSVLLEVGQRSLYLGASTSSSLTLNASHNGRLLEFTGTAGWTFTGFAAVDGFNVYISNISANSLDIAPGSGTLTWIDGGGTTVGTHALPAGTVCYLTRQGSNWFGWTVSAGAGGGSVASVTATANLGIVVDNTDPANPTVGIRTDVFAFTFGPAIQSITYGNSTDFPSHTFWGYVELNPSTGTALTIYGVDNQNSVYIESASTTDTIPDLQVTRASTGTAANSGASIQLRNSGSNRASVLQQIATGFEIHNYNGSAWTNGLSMSVDGVVSIYDGTGLRAAGFKSLIPVTFTTSRNLATTDLAAAIRGTTTGSQTLTLPTSGFAAGDTALLYVDLGGFNVACSGTLRWMQGSSYTDGTPRTLAAGAVVTIMCIDGTNWALWGIGIS